MQDALLMRGLECARNLGGQPDGLCDRQRATQRLALEVLHDQKVDLLVSIPGELRAAAPDIVKGADVRVVQRSDGARFSLEAVACLQIVRELLRQHFDRDRPVEPCIARLVDLTHSTGANQRRDLIVAYALPFETLGHQRARWAGQIMASSAMTTILA